MKKIILGLFLTAGISGSVFAGNSVEKKENSIKVDKIFFECRSSTITNTIDANGNLVSSSQSPWVTISCGGAPDGTNVIKSEIKQLKPTTDINP